MTPQEAATAFRKLNREVRKPALNALRRGITRWRKRYIDRVRTRGIARRIYGKNASGLSKLVSRSRIKDSGETFVAGLTAKGLVGLMEGGGRTRKHPITARNGRLVFRGRSGLVVIPSVEHPGGPIHAVHFLQASLDAELPGIVSELDARLQETANRTVG